MIDSNFAASAEVHDLFRRACLELGYPIEEARVLVDWIAAEHWITAVPQLENLTDMQWSRLNLPVALEATVQRMVADRSHHQEFTAGYSSLSHVGPSQVRDKCLTTFSVRGRRFRVYRDLVAKHQDSVLAGLLRDNDADPNRSIYVDADPNLFRFVVLWYSHGPPVRVPASISVQKLRQEFKALGIELEEGEIAQGWQQQCLDTEVRTQQLADRMKALRVQLCAVQLSKAVAANVVLRSDLGQSDTADSCSPQPRARAHSDFDATPRSFVLNLRPASPTPGGAQRSERDWLLEDEPVCGLSEAGLTAKFDWREVNCSPAFQQALKELGYESTGCELIGDESDPVAYAFTLDSIHRAP